MLSISNLFISVADKSLLKGPPVDVLAAEAPAIMRPNGAVR